MDTIDTRTFSRFEASIRRYSGNAKAPDLLVGSDGPLSCYYAPFDWKNPHARVMLVGITPGLTQANNALKCAQLELERGATLPSMLAEVKRVGAFSGAMRPNLVEMLDHIGLHAKLGINTCAELFASAAHLLQSTSVLPYPVFVNGDNYNGSPDPTRTPFLRQLVLEYFVPFLNAAPQSVILPLGPVPTKVLEWLVEHGKLDRSRLLAGLPHPSMPNAERIAYFVGRKQRESLSTKTNPAKLDAARSHLMGMVERLPV